MGKRLVVMGAPIAHSLSPKIFSGLMQRKGIVNASYYQLYADGSIPIRTLFNELHLHGANITSPLKNIAFASVDSASDVAKTLGAVNTIVCCEGSLQGYNTDPEGVRGALQELGICPAGRRCYVLGAGGAAAAVAYALRLLNAEPIILNRTHARASGLARQIGVRAVPVGEAEPMRGDLLFSCLPPQSTMLPLWDWGVFDWVFDAVYSDSPLEQIAVQYGLARIGAREWLYHQAIAAFGAFFPEGN